jgi:hypothetical protein
MPPATLPAFSQDESDRARAFLALRVAHMMGRKFEEGDWGEVYCKAKGIPHRGWSNLNIDVMHGNLGIEHKMLCYRSKPTLLEACGTTLMHPSATRSIRVPSPDVDADSAMADVLQQYSELLESRRAKVAEQNSTGDPEDMRTGWLLWQESLREFLYFEEPTISPAADLYRAEWHESGRDGGSRKPSVNLWIYEKSTGRKRYSVTTSAGAKIQPYFDVPPPGDPNVYHFVVIGERLEDTLVRVWITRRTSIALSRFVGDLHNVQQLSSLVREAAAKVSSEDATSADDELGEVVALALEQDAYDMLATAMPGINDEHMFQLLVDSLAAAAE